METKSTFASTLSPVEGESVGRGEEALVLHLRETDSRGNVKTAKNGQTVLVPQPTDDPNDPLNWSWAFKHTMLVVVSAVAFLPDYGGAIGAVTLVPQAAEWNTTPDRVLHALIGNSFMVGAAGPFIVAFMAYFGRLPVLFWFMIMSVWTAIWGAGATGLPVFTAARILNGTFSTVAQAGGLVFINDMFFAHEHTRKINIWSSFIILSPFLGPLITSFIVEKHSWRWTFWLYALESGVCLIGVVLFCKESFYDRSGFPAVRQGKASRIGSLVGIDQWRTRHERNTFSEACMRPISAIMKPPIFISTVYYLLIFPWVVAINVTLPLLIMPLYNFGIRQIGFFYFFPVVAVVLGELSGHFLHDLVARISIQYSNGYLHPEARLWAIWVATPLMVAGLVLFGHGLEFRYHYMLVGLGWGMYVFGIMISTVALNAYVLHCYPNGAGEVASWLNFVRTVGGFVVAYFQVKWATDEGPRYSFGAQAAITGAAFVLVLVLQVYGGRLRAWSGPLHFKTN